MATKSVEALLEDVRLLSEERYETVQAVRALAKKVIKPLSEEVKYGGGVKHGWVGLWFARFKLVAAALVRVS